MPHQLDRVAPLMTDPPPTKGSLSFGHFLKKRGGVEPIPKLWGIFEVFLRYVLGCFEVVFGGMFFPKSA